MFNREFAMIGKAGRACVMGLAGMAMAGALGCCQADYSADITNKTSVPISAQIFRKSENGAVMGAYRRLGPGDRELVGPVRTDVGHGAFLVVDSLGNPPHPLTMDISPGQAFLDVTQEGEGESRVLHIVVKP